MTDSELEPTFTVEKDTKNTQRYKEEATDGPPIISMLYVQQWARVGDGDRRGRTPRTSP